MNRILINTDDCDLCCECINICDQEVLGMQNGKVNVVKFDNCIFCEECVDICPLELIRISYDISM